MSLTLARGQVQCKSLSDWQAQQFLIFQFSWVSTSKACQLYSKNTATYITKTSKYIIKIALSAVQQATEYLSTIHQPQHSPSIICTGKSGIVMTVKQVTYQEISSYLCKSPFLYFPLLSSAAAITFLRSLLLLYFVVMSCWRYCQKNTDKLQWIK